MARGKKYTLRDLHISDAELAAVRTAAFAAHKCSECGITIPSHSWSAEVPWCDECRARAEEEVV